MQKTRNMILVALFTALSAITAYIRIPLPFVPITLQTLSVFMAGLLLGKKLGALSQLLYVGLGLIGIPIFTQGGGPGYILKPSFGYLLGFILAAYFIGLIIEKKEINFYNTLLASSAGVVVIYLIGVPYLYLILNLVMNVDISLTGAIKTGMLAFLPGDIIKILFTSLLVPGIQRRLKQGH
jgi:biotin transport system substrate-specific component